MMMNKYLAIYLERRITMFNNIPKGDHDHKITAVSNKLSMVRISV